MANSADVLNYILGHPPASKRAIAYNFLVPNMKGLENFLKVSGDSKAPPTPPPSPKQHASGFPSSSTLTGNPNDLLSRSPSGQDNDNSTSAFTTEISLFAAATEAFSKANTNCTIAESIERFKPIIAVAKDHNIRVRGYVSVALGCPYEGPDVDPVKVA